MLRPIIEIDKEKCNGCGQCVVDCAEGALAIVNGKAELISETYCDGLGACLNCPRDALKLSMRDAPAFDEAAAMAALAKKSGHKPEPFRMAGAVDGEIRAVLPGWPIQLGLLPGAAGFVNNSHLLFAAQCAGFAIPDIHEKWLKGRVPVIACPKLQDNAMLLERLTNLLRGKQILSLTILRMSVPCCGAMVTLAQKASRALDMDTPTDIRVIKL